MFKFNNDNIFTGYLKQLLHDFNLPKYRVYTKEQAEHFNNYNTYVEAEVKKERYNLYQNYKVLVGLLAQHENYLEIAEQETPKNEDSIQFLNTRITNIKKQMSDLEAQGEALEEKIRTSMPRELNILETTYNNVYISYPDTLAGENTIKYPAKMRFFPYIKDGVVQEYANGEWHECHSTFDAYHDRLHTRGTSLNVQHYTYNQKILNYTKNLRIQNNVYDSYTHEYLGDYLRFHRDYVGLNLMPLYNCFSNRACPHLDLSFNINNYKVKFNTDQSFDTSLYKYYMLPVKLFQDYTIALQSEGAVEVCCCIYGAAQNEGGQTKKFSKLPKATYQCFSDMNFATPKLYSKVKNLANFLSKDELLEVAQYEQDLKLILKVPAKVETSIVILEGDYCKYNDSIYSKKQLDFDSQWKMDEALALEQTELESSRMLRNQLVVNLASDKAIDLLTKKLITPLQLLRANTGESYPFADRLLEYLVGNAITLNEEIEDNVIRVKTVVSANCPDMHIDETNGIWNSLLQVLIYNYINKQQNTHDINHDILGFVDKDVEKWYANKVFKTENGERVIDPKTKKPIITAINTISDINIYE